MCIFCPPRSMLPPTCRGTYLHFLPLADILKGLWGVRCVDFPKSHHLRYTQNISWSKLMLHKSGHICPPFDCFYRDFQGTSIISTKISKHHSRMTGSSHLPASSLTLRGCWGWEIAGTVRVRTQNLRRCSTLYAESGCVLYCDIRITHVHVPFQACSDTYRKKKIAIGTQSATPSFGPSGGLPQAVPNQPSQSTDGKRIRKKRAKSSEKGTTDGSFGSSAAATLGAPAQVIDNRVGLHYCKQSFIAPHVI